MAEIKVYNTAIAHQEEAFGFHKVAVAEMAKCKDAKFAPVYQIYKAAYDTFDNALKQGGGEHALSQPIVAQDTVCDKLYRGLNSQVSTMEGFYDPALAEVARQARIILKKYGNPTALPYLEEAGVLHNLILELEAFDGVSDSESPDEISADEITTNRLAAIHIDGWVTRLKTEAARFLELFAERNAQNATIVTGATKAARLAADNACRRETPQRARRGKWRHRLHRRDQRHEYPHRPADCHPQGTCHEERQQAEGRGDERATGGVTTYKIFFFHKHIICNKRGEAVARHPPLIFIIPPILSSRRY